MNQLRNAIRKFFSPKKTQVDPHYQKASYSCDGPWPVKGKSIDLLKNSFAEKRCFLIGNGPSLNKHDLTLLKDEITIGSNAIFYKTEEMGFIPTFYTVEDSELMNNYCKRIDEYTQSIRVIPSNFYDFIANKSDTYWFRMNWGFYKSDSPFYQQSIFSTDFSCRVFSGHTIMYTNMQLAFWMGFAEVYLIGVDHHYIIQPETMISSNQVYSDSDDPNHFHPDYFKGKVWYTPELEKTSRCYQQARITFEKHGRKICNATIGGKLDVFDRVDYLSLFQ